MLQKKRKCPLQHKAFATLLSITSFLSRSKKKKKKIDKKKLMKMHQKEKNQLRFRQGERPPLVEHNANKFHFPDKKAECFLNWPGRRKEIHVQLCRYLLTSAAPSVATGA